MYPPRHGSLVLEVLPRCPDGWSVAAMPANEVGKFTEHFRQISVGELRIAGD